MTSESHPHLKKLVIALASIVALVLVAAGAAYLYLRTSLPDIDGETDVAGISAEIEIWRDSLGVPHVWAASREDMLFAQGYAHAQDRLWQMELFRRVAQGRLSELLGERALDSDRFLRTIGLAEAARAGAAILDEESRRLIEAYVRGVNAAVANRRGALPPEFVLLRAEFEPWTIEDVAAIEKVMAWDLTMYRTGLNLMRAADRLGEERARLLAPRSHPWAATILDAPPPREVPATAAALLDALSATRASNAWVIAGAHTRSRKPILANDMHLALRAPGVWYLMALHGGGTDVVGMTIPGTPFVTVGHNRAIAWGFTNAMVDDADFFVERLDPADSARYLVPGGSEPFRVRVDTIRVKGRDEPVLHTVRMTRNGPVVSDVEGERAAGRLLAFRWGGHLPAQTFRAIRALNDAVDWDDFAAAVADFDNPHQNIVYADTAGHIGYWMSGRVPVRAGGRLPPVAPVPGWTGEWDWIGELRIEQHPHVFDPPQGYVATANNRQAAAADTERITTEWLPPFRAMRIQQMLTTGGPFDVAAVAAQQMDVRDALAERFRDRAVAAARAAQRPEAANTLETWDLRMDRDSRAGALFYVWLRELRRAAARDLYQDSTGWFPDDALHALLDTRGAAWAGADAGTRFAALAADAMRRADSIATGRTWGELHRLRIPHVLSAVPVVGRLLRLDVGGVPADGTPNTVNVSGYAEATLPFIATYGPSQRHVVDLADVDGAGGFVLPAGQSGVPFSGHYRDHFELYVNGGLWRIPLDRAAADARAVNRLVLRPKRSE